MAHSRSSMPPAKSSVLLISDTTATPCVPGRCAQCIRQHALRSEYQAACSHGLMPAAACPPQTTNSVLLVSDATATPCILITLLSASGSMCFVQCIRQHAVLWPTPAAACPPPPYPTPFPISVLLVSNTTATSWFTIALVALLSASGCMHFVHRMAAACSHGLMPAAACPLQRNVFCWCLT